MEPEIVNPEKSPNDQRDYVGFHLQNKLKILLIHDAQISKSACSISVGVGSLQDPDHALGLAHFLQHMLFMGSKNYPDHKSYSYFISSNSGEADAHTDDDQTNFYFQVKNSAFCEAVERLTDCFMHPLLTEECIDKQRQAVHEEFVLWSDDDETRKEEILRKLGSAPFSRFSVGNKYTLDYPSVREDLMSFYDKYYSSNLMNVVLCSHLPIQEMKAKVTGYFERIENKNLNKIKYKPHFEPHQLGKFIRVHSIKDQSKLQFIWIFDNLRTHYQKHVEDYLVHVLGTNTLILTLQEQSYATQITASAEHIQSQTMVKMEITLSDEGEDNYQEVYNITMDFIHGLMPSKVVYEQLKEIKQTEFRFKEKQNQISEEVCDISSLMHHIPLQSILNYTSIFDQFDEEAIGGALAHLNPQNLILVLSTQEKVKGMKEEKYLGGKYRIDSLPKRKDSNTKFSRMAPNQYLPIDTTLFPSEMESVQPKKLHENIFYQSRGPFNVCKGGIKLLVYTQEDYVFKEFYSDYLETILETTLADAYSLQTEINIYADNAFMIQLYGFNDTVTRLLTNIMKTFWSVHNNKQSKSLFEMELEDYIGGYDNFYCDEVDELAEEILDLILIQGNPGIDELKKSVQKYKYQPFMKRVKRFWKQAQMQWIVVGNFHLPSTIELLQSFEKEVQGNENMAEDDLPRSGCLKLTENIRFEAYLSSDEMKTSCCIVYYEAGPYKEQLYYKLKMLENYLNEPFFNELRTEKKLAYHLQVTTQSVRGVLSLQFLLVSSTIDPYEISKEIKNFAEIHIDELDENLSKDELTNLKQSLLTQECNPHANLEDYYQFIVEEIQEKKGNFNRKSKEEVWKHIEDVDVKDLKELGNKLVKKSLDIMIVSKNQLKNYKKRNLKTVKKIQQIKKKAVFHADLITP